MTQAEINEHWAKVQKLFLKGVITKEQAKKAGEELNKGKIPSCLKSKATAKKATAKKATAKKATTKKATTKKTTTKKTTTKKTTTKKTTATSKEKKQAKQAKKVANKLTADMNKAQALLDAKKITKAEYDVIVASLQKGSSYAVAKKKVTSMRHKELKQVKREISKENRKQREKEMVQHLPISPKSKKHYCPAPNSKMAKKHPEMMKGFEEAVANTPKQFKEGRTMRQLWRDYVTPSPIADQKGKDGRPRAIVKGKNGKKRSVYGTRRTDAGNWGI